MSAAAIGLMAGVALQLGQYAIVDLQSAMISLIAAYLLFRRRIGSTWSIAGGAVAGLLVEGAASLI